MAGAGACTPPWLDRLVRFSGFLLNVVSSTNDEVMDVVGADRKEAPCLLTKDNGIGQSAKG